ncbi:B12-binding domain-containing radical SAM protein [Planctomycetota bacterium]
MSFRVLFVYPNLSMSAMVPHSIAVLSSVLKQHKFQVDVFDATHYRGYAPDSNVWKVKVFNALPYHYEERGITYKESDIFDDFRKHVDAIKPDLLAVSFVEDTYSLGSKLLASVRDLSIPVVAGGVFCTYAPETVLANPDIDYAIRGEGEVALVELCKALSSDAEPFGINNLCYLRDGNIVCNPMNAPLDVNELPAPDYSLFEEKALYRAMMGKIYRTVAIELHRGCPYRCTFCNSSANNPFYMTNTGKPFFRKRSMESFADELGLMVKQYDPEFIYFISDTFLLMNEEEFNQFYDIYAQYKIPFFVNTRAETVQEDRIERLSELNCHRLNVGIEHGNEDFRRNVLKRNVSDEKIINAIRIVGESDISTVSNNIIGFPGETRKLIFDTINLNRHIEKYCDSVSCTIFSPYHGTVLRESAVNEGYLNDDVIVDNAANLSSLLEMPFLTKEEIDGLYRTFSMYVRMEKSKWPMIETAEKFDQQGEKMYEKLHQEHMEKYVLCKEK